MGDAMFIDLARIRVKGGAGGAGAMAFRRERGVPRGGPAGGNGGRGGDVVLIADPQLDTLLDYSYRENYAAGRDSENCSSRATVLLLPGEGGAVAGTRPMPQRRIRPHATGSRESGATNGGSNLNSS